MSRDNQVQRSWASFQITTPPSGTQIETPPGKKLATPSGNKSRCTALAGTASMPSGNHHVNNLVNNLVIPYIANSNIAKFQSAN